MSEKKEETGQSLEETFLERDEPIAQMEQPGQSLDESFRLYQQGTEKLKLCNQMLDEVEKKMQVLAADGTLEEF